MTRMHILKIMLEIVSVIIVLGIAVNLSAALSPQPEPPKIYVIEFNSARGLFNGEIVSPELRPQPEPPIYNIGMNTSKGLFSGLIVSIV
jgi:hypothetical protein